MIATMKKNLTCLACFVCFVVPLLALDACSIAHAPPQAAYDLGNAAAAPAAGERTALPPVLIAEPVVPGWLDTADMTYRLQYANDQQLRPYANSRWSAPPVQLFEQRLKAGIAAAGGRVLSSSEAANNVQLVLHLDADDFTQVFDRADHSNGRVALRVSLFNGRALLDQTVIVKQVEAHGADAAAGARALAGASDAAVADIVHWLGSVDVKK